MTDFPGVKGAACLAFRFNDYALKERLASKLCSSYGRWLAGFRTFELRGPGGREGFEIEVLGGKREVLASKRLVSPVCFNKYGMNLAVLETSALGALRAGAAAGKVLLFDELGPMAMLSPVFSSGAVELLFSGRRCAAFYRRGAGPFEDAFSRMRDTVIIELSQETWAEAVAASQAWLDGIIADMETNR
jgi:nucleoside-triphosphatase THEP1